GGGGRSRAAARVSERRAADPLRAVLGVAARAAPPDDARHDPAGPELVGGGQRAVDPDAAEVAVPVGGAVGGARPDDDDPEEGPPADGGAAEGRRGAGGPAGPERPVESIRGRGEARDAGAGGALRQDG